MPHRPGLGAAGGPLTVSRLPKNDIASACANVAELMHSKETDNALFSDARNWVGVWIVARLRTRYRSGLALKILSFLRGFNTLQLLSQL